MIREIVRIDEEKCDGCGLCVPACAEGAIRIVNGKAKLIADNLCDGLGACLGHCPQDAIIVERREAEEFDEAAVEVHLHGEGRSLPDPASTEPTPRGSCPSARVIDFGPAAASTGGCPSAQALTLEGKPEGAAAGKGGRRSSELRQWPVQMHLVPPTAPFLRGADLLLAADCAAFAHADFHKELLRERALLIGCPKLDDGRAYLEKLTAVLAHNDIRRLTVAHMEVPCCSGLIMIARQAIAASGKDVPLETVRIGIQGDIK